MCHFYTSTQATTTLSMFCSIVIGFFVTYSKNSECKTHAVLLLFLVVQTFIKATDT